MNLKLLRRFLAVGLMAVAGHCWGTESITPTKPANGDTTWQDISNIEWRADGGSWGQSAVVVGQSVEFKITMHKTNIGNHYADFLKVWIDLNGDGNFGDANEELLFDYQVTGNPSTQYVRATERPSGLFHDFTTSKAITVTDTSSLWLLARVTCSESLLNEMPGSHTWADQWSTDISQYKKYFTPTADFSHGQGESELVKLTVNSVPEPGTLALFSVAMLGMGWIRKKTTRV